MIVQCDQCNSKFRLDDAKVKEGGVKVRCSKCKNIFLVQREAPAEEADFDSFLSGLMPPPPGAPNESQETAPDAEPSVSQITGETGQSLGMETPVGEELFARGEIPKQDDFDLSEFTFNDQTLSSEPAPASAERGKGKPEEGFVFGELDLGSRETSEKIPEGSERGAGEFPCEEIVSKGIPASSIPEFELDIDGFDGFGETEGTVTASAPPSLKAEEDFFDDSPEEFSFGPETSERKAPKAGEDSIAAAPEEFFFEPETDVPNTASLGLEEEKGLEQPGRFDYGELEFGESAASGTGETVKQKLENWDVEEQKSSASREISPLPLPEMQSFEEEPPPLSIPSRRRGRSFFPIAVVVAVLLVLALTGGGFYFSKEGPTAFSKLGLGFIAKWIGVENSEEGGIAVRNSVGVFLNNKEAGEIFAINGEAVNNFGKPRASIQVKATLLGPKGEVLLQKQAYCGNVLSREQLSVLPAAKLEAAMNNQFGDSLSNLAVQPGQGIPFVIVLTNVPKDTVEFGVEVVGSTVASQ